MEIREYLDNFRIKKERAWATVHFEVAVPFAQLAFLIIVTDTFHIINKLLSVYSTALFFSSGA
jgi:hypothetical protein